LRIILSALIKKPQRPARLFFETPLNGQHNCIFILGIEFANHLLLRVWLCLGRGELTDLEACGDLLPDIDGVEVGRNTTHAPVWFVRRLYRDQIKGVAINYG
jgi:hypothetical protein